MPGRAPSFFTALSAQLHLEWMLERKRSYVLFGLLLYVFATVFTLFLAATRVSPGLWVALFWVVQLFVAVNAVAKGFLQDSSEQRRFSFLATTPEVFYTAKVLYGTGLMATVCLLSLGTMALFMGWPIQGTAVFAATVVLGVLGLGTVFTTVSAIGSRANNASTLMAVLGFPLAVPILLLCINVGRVTIEPTAFARNLGNLSTLAATDVIAFAVGFVLFPYLWRD